MKEPTEFEVTEQQIKIAWENQGYLDARTGRSSHEAEAPEMLRPFYRRGYSRGQGENA